MSPESGLIQPVTLDSLRKQYLPGSYNVDEIKSELISTVPLSHTELEEMLQQTLDNSGYAPQSHKILVDAYVTAKHLRTFLREDITEEELQQISTKPAEAYGGRTLIEVFKAREFEMLINEWEHTFSWSGLG